MSSVDWTTEFDYHSFKFDSEWKLKSRRAMHGHQIIINGEKFMFKARGTKMWAKKSKGDSVRFRYDEDEKGQNLIEEGTIEVKDKHGTLVERGDRSGRGWYNKGGNLMLQSDNIRLTPEAEARAALKREETRLAKYDLVPADRDRMLEEQGGVCKICKGVNANGNVLSVDHNHKTEKVRGLLCSNCNLMLGNSKDEPETLRSAARYLEESEQRRS